MSENEIIILITGIILGGLGAVVILGLGYVILTIKDKRDELRYRKEHRLENLMMEQAERGLEDRE